MQQSFATLGRSTVPLIAAVVVVLAVFNMIPLPLLDAGVPCLDLRQWR